MRDYLELLELHFENGGKNEDAVWTRFERGLGPKRYPQGQTASNSKPRFHLEENSEGSILRRRLDKLSNDITGIENSCCSAREKPEPENEQKPTFGKRGYAICSFSSALAKLTEAPPEGVLNSRWVEAVLDAEDFLATWGAQAEVLGWTVDDLFGLNPIAPLRRHDEMGLIWTLQDCPVIALTEHTAVIEMPTGNELTFYRRGIEFPWRRQTSK